MIKHDSVVRDFEGQLTEKDKRLMILVERIDGMERETEEQRLNEATQLDKTKSTLIQSEQIQRKLNMEKTFTTKLELEKYISTLPHSSSCQAMPSHARPCLHFL